jgi:hypothetical protein
MSAAPYLHQETVTFHDIVAVAGGSSGGVSYAQLTPNGVNIEGLTQKIPQELLWN